MTSMNTSLNDFSGGRDEMRSQATWEENAACQGHDPKLWDTYRKSGVTVIDEDVRDAKEICADCPVKRQCLVHGILFKSQFTIRGGMTDEERDAWATRKLKRYRLRNRLQRTS